jgi:ketosteroid isomerase-like protein
LTALLLGVMVESIGLQEGKGILRYACLRARRGAPTIRRDALSAGDLEALMSLYEAQAILLAQPGETPAKGTEEIRAALQGFLATEPMLTIQVRQIFEADDLALSFADWNLTGAGPDGEAIEMSGQTSYVLCR